MVRWIEATVGDVLTLQRGFDITRDQQQLGIVPVVSSGGIASFHDTAMVQGPGVVIGRKGTLGTVFFLDVPYWPHDTTLWVKDFKGSWPRFVYYFMKQMDVSFLDVGSANPTLNRNHVHPLRVSWPPAAEQRAIAEVLGSLDDKIAANNKLIDAADELSRVVFTRMLNDTTSRPLSDVAEFVNGKAFTKDASGTGRVVIRIAELNSGLGGSTVYNDIDVADQHLARPGDLLFAWSGSLTLHRWFRAEGIINQHIFKVLPKDGYPTWCVSALLVRKLDEFKGIAADKATTMGHIQRRHLDEPVEVPVAAQIERNDALMTSLWQRALAAEEESLGLVAMRDALLPQLMSGRIRVKDAEQMAGDVV